MTTPEQPKNPEGSNIPDPTELPPSSTLPESTPLSSPPLTTPPAPAATPASPAEAGEPSEPAATQAFPPVDPNAPTQAYPGAPEYVDPGAPGAPGAPGYPAAPGYATGGVPPQAPMNTLAIVALVGSFFISLVGIICGHIALKQIKRDGTRGRGLALAGTIIGYVTLAITIISIIVAITIGIAGINAANNALDSEMSEGFSTSEEAPADMFEEDATEEVPAASSDFCAIFDDVSSLDTTNVDSSVDLYQRLADAAPSAESSAIYEQMAGFLKDPASFTTDSDIDAFTESLTSTLMADAMTCL